LSIIKLYIIFASRKQLPLLRKQKQAIAMNIYPVQMKRKSDGKVVVQIKNKRNIKMLTN
jgi:hypothetical protein